jgi:hypothetical protein
MDMIRRVGAYLARNHVALLALFIALGGTSYAVSRNSVGTNQLRNNSVRSADIRNDNRSGGGLTGTDIRNSALAGRDVRDASLTGSDIRGNSLFTSDIATSAIGADELSANSVRGSELAPSSVESDEVRNGSLRRSDFAAGQLFSGTVVRSDSIDVAAEGGFAEPDVSCAAGERAVGGGLSLLTPSSLDRVVYSRPESGGAIAARPAGTANGWAGGIINGANSEDTAVVWAVCAA